MFLQPKSIKGKPINMFLHEKSIKLWNLKGFQIHSFFFVGVLWHFIYDKEIERLSMPAMLVFLTSPIFIIRISDTLSLNMSLCCSKEGLLLFFSPLLRVHIQQFLNGEEKECISQNNLCSFLVLTYGVLSTLHPTLPRSSKCSRLTFFL